MTLLTTMIPNIMAASTSIVWYPELTPAMMILSILGSEAMSPKGETIPDIIRSSSPMKSRGVRNFPRISTTADSLMVSTNTMAKNMAVVTIGETLSV